MIICQAGSLVVTFIGTWLRFNIIRSLNHDFIPDDFQLASIMPIGSAYDQ
ncbi:MAG: hypothetical protein QF569_29220 [Candidatus Poribacteria bacterium]|jgi:hypothetical protein|nr:hypothetical protein [Candidatus Poribacteria bacterium]